MMRSERLVVSSEVSSSFAKGVTKSAIATSVAAPDSRELAGLEARLPEGACPKGKPGRRRREARGEWEGNSWGQPSCSTPPRPLPESITFSELLPLRLHVRAGRGQVVVAVAKGIDQVLHGMGFDGPVGREGREVEAA